MIKDFEIDQLWRVQDYDRFDVIVKINNITKNGKRVHVQDIQILFERNNDGEGSWTFDKNGNSYDFEYIGDKENNPEYFL